MTSEEYVKLLNMEPHPEGGYFIQTYLGNDKVNNTPLYSSIIFMLCTGEVSHLHRLKEDELWYFHDGEALDIVEITPEGKMIKTALGRDIAKGEVLQYLVKKGSIFGSVMHNEGYSLVGCMVAPAFSYEHFELFKRSELIVKYPQYEKEITELTYND